MIIVIDTNILVGVCMGSSAANEGELLFPDITIVTPEQFLLRG